jgi:alkylation response protein AidB-like acyl-CoA dehydrogenase
MRFALTDDQGELRDAVRAVLDKEGAAGWAALAEMGVLSVTLPEEHGGLGLDEVWLVPLLEEAGRAALAAPIVESAAVAAPLGITGMVASDLGGPVVPWADEAERFLLRADDGRLHLLERGAVTVEPVETVDQARRAGRVTWSPSASSALDEATDGDLAFDRGALGTAAQLCGLAQRMLDMTVVHVTEREQFGVPIGSFQAVKHHLADALMQLRFARPTVLRAAWSIAEGEPARARDVSMAKAMASDAASLVGRKALQCHGAIGYTVEYDLHLYLKRTWALASSWGTAAWHRARVAEAIDA